VTPAGVAVPFVGVTLSHCGKFGKPFDFTDAVELKFTFAELVSVTCDVHGVPMLHESVTGLGVAERVVAE
jgi:hypothetical protein